MRITKNTTRITGNKDENDDNCKSKTKIKKKTRSYKLEMREEKAIVIINRTKRR